jgi:Ca2+/Na+ antiporter
VPLQVSSPDIHSAVWWDGYTYARIQACEVREMAELSSLGPVLVEKKLPRASGIAVLGVCAVMLYVVIAAGELNAAAIGLTAFVLLLVVMAVWTFSYRAAIHENGASTSSIFGKRTVSFADMKSFSYARTVTNRQPMDVISFTPQKGKPVRVVTQPSPLSRGDQDLAVLADRLTERFALKMEQDLARRNRVQWVNGNKGTIPPNPPVVLTRDGYLVGEGATPRTILFSEVQQEIVNGVFYLRRRDDRKTEFQCRCSIDNFYPGLTLSRKLQPGGN